MKRIEYPLGFKINGCTYLGEASPTISSAGRKSRRGQWKCYCGKLFVAAFNNIKSGSVKSCGCWKIKTTVARLTKHGHSRAVGNTKLYRAWKAIKERCYNSHSRAFKWYGAKGIQIYGPWRSSFLKFKQYFKERFGIEDIPSELTIDRINGTSHYQPGNLRLITLAAQQNNKCNNVKVLYKGQIITLVDLSTSTGIAHGLLKSRLQQLRRNSPNKISFPIQIPESFTRPSRNHHGHYI